MGVVLAVIQTLITGRWEVDTWYYAPYPGEYGNCSTLYVCEFCLKYMRKESAYRRHCGRCTHRKPPGKEIYTDTGGDAVEHVSIAGRQQRHASSASKAPQPKTQAISVFEVDGQEHKMYCQVRVVLFATTRPSSEAHALFPLPPDRG